MAKLAEDKKFKADEMSSQPISCKHGGDHVFVPFASSLILFAMEDGGTLGAHARALLKTLDEHAVSAARYSSPDSRSPLSPSMQVSLWSLDAALAASPFHVAACQPFTADSPPLQACRDPLC